MNPGDRTASWTASGALALGLLVPLGGGLSERAVAAVTALASPPKHVTLVRDGRPVDLVTRAATVADLLTEAGIVAAPEDALSPAPSAALADGATVSFRDAVPVSLAVDDAPPIALRSAAATVGELLAGHGIRYDRHDRIAPAPSAPLGDEARIRVVHVTEWIEQRRQAIPPPVRVVADLRLPAGKTRVVDPGLPGTRETDVRWRRGVGGRSAIRTELAARVVRAPRPRIVARGIATYAEFAALARRGFLGTIGLAESALDLVATAYTAGCPGCSGMTASGRRAGHGVVAVDPSVIPLGTRMFVPGYGVAVAGDTGGAIRGRRIDLGFDSPADAMAFGRRPVTVYLLGAR